MGKHTLGQCCLCGKTGVVTKDHAIPRNLFRPPRPTNLITVPACGECNNSLKLDEEYFRACLLSGLLVHDHPEANGLWNTKVLPRLQSQVGLSRLLASQRRLISVKGESGQVVENVPVLEVDRQRIERVVKKIVRGLYYHHESKILGPDEPLMVAVDLLDPESGLEKTFDIWKLTEPHELGRGTLSYRYGVADGRPAASVWWLVFYSGAVFTVITGVTEDEAEALAEQAIA